MRHIIRNIAIFDGTGSAPVAGAVVFEDHSTGEQNIRAIYGPHSFHQVGIGFDAKF